MSVDIKYEEHYVAFLDILGFKEIIKNKNCLPIYEVFERIKRERSTILSVNGNPIGAFDSVQEVIMSDSIVLFIRSNLEESLFALLWACQNLQTSLLMMDEPVLLRGGITKGELFYNGNNIIFGKALTKAYNMENNIAIYPRIIINRGLLNSSEDFPICENYGSILKDEDEYYYINYLNIMMLKDVNDGVIIVEHILKHCQKYIDDCDDINVRNKYLWLKNTTKKIIDNNRDNLNSYPKWQKYFESKGDL